MNDKKILSLTAILFIAGAIFAGCSAQKSMFKASVNYTIEDGVIVLE